MNNNRKKEINLFTLILKFNISGSCPSSFKTWCSDPKTDNIS